MDPSIDIVVELIGSDHPAIEIYEAAFTAHKHVVTANKAFWPARREPCRQGSKGRGTS
jgi:homoserine dehydrogenase